MSILATMQQELADKLLADPFFATIPVLTERIKDLQSQLEIAIERGGLCVVVTTPVANVVHADPVTTCYFEDIIAVGRVIENVAVNQAAVNSPSALEVAEQIAADWYNFKPEGINETWTPLNPTIVLGNDPIDLSYDVRYKTSGGISNPVPQVSVPMPQMAVVDANTRSIILTNATAGATMWYTLAGPGLPSPYPAPRNSQLYTAPFIVDVTGGPVTLKIRGWLPGYTASPVVVTTVS